MEFEEPTRERPVQIIMGDARQELLKLPDEKFQCCVTSPPYWGVRDYGVTGQIGAEPDLNDYINDLVKVFREVRRVLKPDGTFWLNIGNTYTSGGRTWRQEDSKNRGRGMSYRPPTPTGLKKKDLIGVAWMLAMACQLDGWYLRNDIIWFKPNCQPESVRDRLTVSHEYLFLMTKSERYSFHQDAIKETTKEGSGLKNKRTVWSITTEPYPGAHFAVFPASLVRPCILAGSQEDDIILDPFFGAGTVGKVAMELNRRCLGIEMKPDYVELAKKRIQGVQMSLFKSSGSKIPTTNALGNNLSGNHELGVSVRRRRRSRGNTPAGDSLDHAHNKTPV
jgi:site-specific DNA-methyltransferase (cytosine-N4-specific)